MCGKWDLNPRGFSPFELKSNAIPGYAIPAYWEFPPT